MKLTNLGLVKNNGSIKKLVNFQCNNLNNLILLKTALINFYIIICLVALNNQSFAVTVESNIPKTEDFSPVENTLPEDDTPTIGEPEEEISSTSENLKFTVTKFNFIGNTVLTDDQLVDLTENFLNKEYNFTELQEILRFISTFYRNLGLWARAILP